MEGAYSFFPHGASYPPFMGHPSTGNEFIDPNLQDCEGDSMQRYLEDLQNPIFTHLALPQSQYTTPYQNIYYGTASPSLVSSQPRGGSPFSQHQSSNASSALSPRTESEQFYESAQGPPSPPGKMKSPFLSDTWDDTMTLMGISPSLPPTCINPSDIHPSLGPIPEEPAALDPTLDFLASSPRVQCEAIAAVTPPFPSVHSPLDSINVRTSPPPAQSDIEMSDEDPELTIIVKTEGKTFKAPVIKTRRGRGKRVNSLARPARVTKINPNGFATRRLPSTPSNSHYCTECSEGGFKDAATLQKHIKTQHKRPFVCVFNFAGCPDAFASKNEWKRHVSAQHLNFTFWLCTTGQCGGGDGDEPDGRVLGRPFRRKDLYTQHLRRMHIEDPAVGTSKSNKYGLGPRECQVKELQDEALKQRCEMPQYMTCPAKSCHQDFRGPKAWDERMEHVARHLDAVSNGAEPPVEFGGAHDETLIKWASSKDVKVIMWRMGQWHCRQPLKSAKVDVMKLTRRVGEAGGEVYIMDDSS